MAARSTPPGGREQGAGVGRRPAGPPAALAGVTLVLDGVVTAMAVVAGLMMLFMTLLITYSIFSRYYLSNALGWSVEISEYLLLWSVFLAAPWVLRQDGHVRIDLLLVALKPRGRRRLENLNNLIGVVVSLVLFGYSFLTTYEAFVRNTPVVKLVTLPKWVILSVIPLGFLMLAYQFLRRTLATWHQVEAPSDQGSN